MDRVDPIADALPQTIRTAAQSFPALWRRAPYFVGKILKGGSPATIPVEQASRYEFIINLKTARALELPIQESLLFRADHVIR